MHIRPRHTIIVMNWFYLFDNSYKFGSGNFRKLFGGSFIMNKTQNSQCFLCFQFVHQWGRVEMKHIYYNRQASA